MTTLTIGMSDAKTNFSKITAKANETGMPVTVFKNNKPWVEIRPLASKDGGILPEETLAAVAEAKDMGAHPERYRRYGSPEELFAALDI